MPLAKSQGTTPPRRRLVQKNGVKPRPPDRFMSRSSAVKSSRVQSAGGSWACVRRSTSAAEVHVRGVELDGQLVQGSLVHHRLDERGMDVGETTRAARRRRAAPGVEGDAEPLREQLHSLGRDVDHVGGAAAAISVRIFEKKSFQSVACTASSRTLMPVQPLEVLDGTLCWLGSMAEPRTATVSVEPSRPGMSEALSRSQLAAVAPRPAAVRRSRRRCSTVRRLGAVRVIKQA